jgi:gliding motility-associated lipoprotein GldH
MKKTKEARDRNLKTMQIRATFSILVVFLTTSCRQNNVFERYTSIHDGWSKHEIVSYDFTINDTLQKQNLYIKLRTSELYEYSNLYLIVDLKYPNGKVEKDTLEYQMARPDGSMMGEGLMSIKEHKLWHKGHESPFAFAEKGDYKISINHAMRALDQVSGITSLAGVLDVGFCIENLE